MPKNKDLKRLVRSRMQKTGESYTASRARLLAKKDEKNKQPIDTSLAGMSDEAVQAKTGKTWEEWVHALDARDAASMPHRDTAKMVHEELGIPHWWAQTVTVGYERIKGLREVGQQRSGTYQISKSKTVPVPIADLYRAFRDKRIRERWLPGVDLTIRKATPERSMRITWEDGTSVELWFTAKGETKSQVGLGHTKLASKEDAETRKAYWTERFAVLAELLTASEPSAG